jgi:hypothetical protein
MSLARFDLWENFDSKVSLYPDTSEVRPIDHRSDADLVVKRSDHTHSYVNCRDTPFAGFAAGTKVATATGKTLVENLKRGDLVLTEDHGPQPIRWVCHNRTPVDSSTKLIEILPGAIGNKRRLLLSPLHHVLVSGWRVELLFGAGQALVAAYDLVNETTIRHVQHNAVSLTNFLFDRHEIVVAEGGRCESFFPTERNLLMLEQMQREDLLAWFPELQWCTDTYGKAARQCLTAREAGMLLA